MKPQSQGLHWIWFVVAGLAVLLLAIIAANLMRHTQPPPSAPPQPILEAQPQPQATVFPEGPPPPARFAAQIEALGQSFDGRVGIVVQSIDEGWAASFAGADQFPQQSVSKLWVAATVLDLVDQGKMRLADPITLTRADLTIFHQPIRKRIGGGQYNSTVSELLWFAMTQSDNTANDVLFRRVGGHEGVVEFLSHKGLEGIAMGPGEKRLQTQNGGDDLG